MITTRQWGLVRMHKMVSISTLVLLMSLFGFVPALAYAQTATTTDGTATTTSATTTVSVTDTSSTSTAATSTTPVATTTPPVIPTNAGIKDQVQAAFPSTPVM